MWPLGMPVAVPPLWQVAQPPVIPAWSKPEAGVQAREEWQLSQGAVVTMWFPGLPVAVLPSWQLAQPLVIPA
jgi:hypothetical protein